MEMEKYMRDSLRMIKWKDLVLLPAKMEVSLKVNSEITIKKVMDTLNGKTVDHFKDGGIKISNMAWAFTKSAHQKICNLEFGKWANEFSGQIQLL